MIKGSEHFEAEGGEEESNDNSSDADIMAKAVKQTGEERQVAIMGQETPQASWH